MKKTLLWTLVAAMVVASGAATAGDIADGVGYPWDDLSWWAESGATPEPVKDATRSGYWWWPTEPASNAGDAELWGNRGVVYAQWDPAPPPPPEPPAPPEKPERIKEVRSVPVLNNVLFDFDKSVIKAEGKEILDGKVIPYLNQYSSDTVVVEGHTCSVGAEDYNMALGQRRADAVAGYLKENGISGNRISSVSKGETQPAVPNDTPANRKLNRRAVFVITVVD